MLSWNSNGQVGVLTSRACCPFNGALDRTLARTADLIVSDQDFGEFYCDDASCRISSTMPPVCSISYW